jgi:hypothetical protein
MRTLVTTLVIIAVAAATASAQPAPAKLTVGIYAPSVEFGTAQARLAYVQGLAKAIEQNTGIKTEAQSYASVAALKKDNVDFAIIDGQCFATNLGLKLLANATIGGAPTRAWALFSSAGDTVAAVSGKKLAFVQTGCNDTGFVDNAMFEGDPAVFSARVGEKDLTAAIADVVSYKTAQAVFAPVGSTKGLVKVFDAGAVPNPAFVEMSGKLPQAISDKVAAAVVGYGGSGAINGWSKAVRDPYAFFAARLVKVTKSPILANPEAVRLDGKDVLADLPTLRDAGLIAVRHQFVRATNRME